MKTNGAIVLSATNCFLKQFVRNYQGTWKRVQLQNPHIAHAAPTTNLVKREKFKKAQIVYTCGLGITGSLGLEKFYRGGTREKDKLKSSEISSSTFRALRQFKSSDTLYDVACGYGFTLVAGNFHGSQHSLVGFGLNSHSQIGYHSYRPGYPLEIVSTPSSVLVPTNSPIHRVACGRSHSLLLNKNGQVFSIGNNSLGQCARPINEKENYFGSKIVHRISELPDKIVQVECGQDHSLFLTEDGNVYSCGWGADGQTGLGHFDTQSCPSLVKGDINGVKIIKVSSYADTVLALDQEGNVFGWGNAEYSQFRTLTPHRSEQIGTPTKLNIHPVLGKVVDIAAGGTMCAVLNDMGQVYVWGFGILGKGPQVEQSNKPVLIPESLFGKNIYNPTARVEKIYASLSHFAAIGNQGDLFTWGKNRGSCLGFEHHDNQYYPMKVNINLAIVKKVALGVDHTCVLAEKVI